MNKSTSIYVATHKKINLSLPNNYKVIQLKCDLFGQWDGYIHDNVGNNISNKIYFSELSALYWIWKNDQSDIKGLCHYRRYFSMNNDSSMTSILKYSSNELYKKVINSTEIEKAILTNDSAIIAQKYLPFPETGRQELCKYVYDKDVKTFENLIYDEYPEYYDTFKSCLDSTNLSFYNMFIASKELFNSYCEWLFPILFKLETLVDITDYDEQHKRYVGYCAEILLNVYLKKNKCKLVYYKPILMVENNLKKKIYKISQIIDHSLYKTPLYSFYVLAMKICNIKKFQRYIKFKEEEKYDK